MIENITVTKKVQKRQEIVKPPDGRFEKYLEYLQRTDGFRDSEIDYVRSEISSVLEKCSFENEAGLVVGYIQSGKTTSFIGLMALAADNNVPLYIVI